MVVMKLILVAVCLALIATIGADIGAYWARMSHLMVSKEWSRKLSPKVKPIWLGCWKDVKTDRAISGGIRRVGTVLECWEYAKEHNYKVFAVENTIERDRSWRYVHGECFTAPDAQFTYKKHGPSHKCDWWTGGKLAMDVYRVEKDYVPPPPFSNLYTSLGCFKDEPVRAISGGIRLRGTIEDCGKYAKERGNAVFAVQYGDECFTAQGAENTYNKYGHSDKCGEDGRGGSWAMNVYSRSYVGVGCFKDAAERAVAGGVRLRGTIEQCYQYARQHFYTTFAMENDNECFTGPEAQDTYSKYGTSDRCYGKGRGGAWAMDVYKITHPDWAAVRTGVWWKPGAVLFLTRPNYFDLGGNWDNIISEYTIKAGIQCTFYDLDGFEGPIFTAKGPTPWTKIQNPNAYRASSIKCAKI